MKSITLKFGGSSLADAAQFRKVAEIVKADPARRFVVVSAPGKRSREDTKVTDLLYQCCRLAQEGQDFDPVLKSIRDRFAEIIDGLGIEFELDAEFAMIRAQLKFRPQNDYMASRGEYLNAKIMAAYLGFSFVDPACVVHFTVEGRFDAERTEADLKYALKDIPNAVIAGFYGARPDGTVQTFSRGGSDITGAIVAAALGSELYENWTDVSGMRAADPRIVEQARVVEYITYRELRILSYMGATVLHTDAVYPVRKLGIPINIRNTNCPEHPGTMIVDHLPEGRCNQAVTGVAGRKGLSVVQVEKAMVSDGAGFTALLLDIFKARQIPFEQCLTGIDTISVVVRSDLFSLYRKEILRDIREQLNPDTLLVTENLSMITVVGESIPGTNGIIVRILDAVAEAGIEINTINQGSGDLNLIIGVAEADYEKTIRVIYDAIEG